MTTLTHMDTTFPHSYECKQLIEVPGSSSFAHYYYPRACIQGGRDGLIVEIHRAGGQPWLGTFAFGQVAPNGLSGIFTTPDAERLCVVSRGEGYFVSANAPELWERVEATSIFDVRPVLSKGLIVFADFTRLLAYGEGGLKWRTERLAWDRLKITEVTETFIKGEFWDIRSLARATFIVDLTSGAHEGGIQEF